MVQTIRPESGLRKRSQEQVAVWRGGKGKQIKQENKILNPVHVTGCEANHGTICLSSPPTVYSSFTAERKERGVNFSSTQPMNSPVNFNMVVFSSSSSSSDLQLFVSFGLLNYFSPWFSFLCLLFSIIYSHLPQIVSHIIIPS